MSPVRRSGVEGRFPRAQPLPPHLQDSAFTVQDGLTSGLSKGQLRHPRFIRMSRGICAVEPAELDLASRVRPFTRVAGSSAASHDTAARLWGFPEPVGHRFDRRIHISRPAGSARMQRPGVMGHRSGLLPEEIVYVDGLCVTTRTRTWLDLAETLDLEDLVVIADYLLRVPRPAFEGRSEPYATQKELQGLLRRHPGRRGLRNAREALALARVGADSPPETRLRLAMLRAGLPEPAVNQPIKNDDGDMLHSPDLSLPEYRIAIEYDGEGHGESGQIARDIEREERVRSADWDEVRISNRHMANGARRAVEKIAAALRARGWSQDNAA